MPLSGARVSFGVRKFHQFCVHLILDDFGKLVNIDIGAPFADDLKLGVRRRDRGKLQHPVRHNDRGQRHDGN